MGLKVINVQKDASKVLTRSVKGIRIQTKDNLNEYDPTDPATAKYGFLNAGFIEEGTVKLSLKQMSHALITKEKYQYGYEFSFEITSLQYYSLYEFEKFRNEVCWISLDGLDSYLINVTVNVELDMTVGDMKGAIKLSGTKYVENIREVIDGNPWGTLPPIWASPKAAAPATPPSGVPENTSTWSYEYALDYPELITYITPAVPTTTVEDFKLTLVDESHQPLTVQPTVATVKKRDGDTLTTVATADWSVVFEDEVYRLSVAGTATYQLNDHIIVYYTW